MKDKPTSYTEWVDGIKKNKPKVWLRFTPEKGFHNPNQRGITHKQDNIIYVEFKNG